jgi:hypothetical protein
MYKFLIGLLLVASTLYADLITTFEFDIEESALSFNRPGWDETEDTFYYNLFYLLIIRGLRLIHLSIFMMIHSFQQTHH